MTRAEAGRLGGLATFDAVGVAGMRERGKKGGRPRQVTLEELERQEQLLRPNETDALRVETNNLNEMKRLWRLRRESTGIAESTPGPAVPPQGDRSREGVTDGGCN